MILSSSLRGLGRADWKDRRSQPGRPAGPLPETDIIMRISSARRETLFPDDVAIRGNVPMRTGGPDSGDRSTTDRFSSSRRIRIHLKVAPAGRGFVTPADPPVAVPS